MKKLFSLLVLVASATTIFSQNIIDRHFQDLVDSDESTVVHVAGLTFQMAANFISEEDKDEQEFVQSIKSFDLVALRETANATDEYKKALTYVSDDYEELIKVKDKDGNFSLFIDEEDGVVYEVVGVGASTDDFVLFTLLGEMQLDQIGSMISKIEDQDFSMLKDVNISSGSDISIYPNPVNTSGSISVDIPDDLQGGTATLIDPRGKKVSSFSIDQTTHTIKTNDLNPGYYVVAIEKGGVSIKKKVLIVR